MKRISHHPVRKTILLVCLGLILVGLLALWLRPATTQAPDRTTTSNTKKTETADKKPEPLDLQPTVDAWVAAQPQEYAVVVYDPASKSTVASHQPDKQFFTASIYKLYVAYLSLMDFESGAQNPDEVILAGQTRKECVYKMIHSSDSPCGETMLNAMGGVTLTNRLKSEFGFTGTNFPAFLTTAGDTNRILVRLQAKQDLNAEHTAFLLDAMRTQIYRNGLPAGMKGAMVADKVGFDSPDLWMDTGIITLPDKREFIITIYGKGGVSSPQIADFGNTLYTELTKN